MLFPRILLCIVAGAWTCSLHATLEPPPRLLFSDGEDSYLVMGHETVAQRTRLYFIDSDGETQSLESLNGVRIEGSPSGIRNVGTPPKSYALIQTQPETGRSFRVANIDIPRELAPEASGNIIYTLAWIHENGVELLYANKQLHTLYDLSVPHIDGQEFEGRVGGHVAILAFEKGNAFLPRFVKQKGDEAILNAALNGFSENLAAALAEKESFRGFPFDDLLMAATQNGRTKCIQIILDTYVALKKEPKREAKKLPKSPSSFLMSAIARRHKDSLSLLASHPYFAPSRKKEKDIVSYAIRSHQFEMADILREAGFPLSTSSGERLEVIVNALQANRTDIVETIKKQTGFRLNTLKLNTDRTLYHHIASSAKIETLEYIDQYDLPIDRADEDSYPPP